METERAENHFACRVIPPPTVRLDMTDEERAIMARHAACWPERREGGQIVAYGPVVTGDTSYGLGLTRARSEEEVRAFTAADPAFTSGLMRYEIGRMPVGVLRRP